MQLIYLVMGNTLELKIYTNDYRLATDDGRRLGLGKRQTAGAAKSC